MKKKLILGFVCALAFGVIIGTVTADATLKGKTLASEEPRPWVIVTHYNS